ncbi:MAG: UPF0489 family protein [Selenomonadaceae bacterium]|nr:UPF0489 family protein [Selenomonadaceae bacterium]
MAVPVIIVDEHHEAFWAWHFFIENNFIAQDSNYLLHVDHHDDFESGGYACNFDNLPQNFAQAKEFTYEFLGIADFIAPALYQKIFSTVHILKNLKPNPLQEENLFFRCADNHVLNWGQYIPFLHAAEKKNPDSKYKFFTKIEGGLNETDKFPAENLVLDIDLDYFCWDDSLKSVPEKRVEITAEAYADIVKNKNNPFRILPRKLLTFKEEGGRYFLVYEENLSRKPLPTEEKILQRIDRLINYFLKVKLKPAAVDICRSSYSGYLPAERAAFVEKNFLAKLGAVMDLKFLG